MYTQKKDFDKIFKNLATFRFENNFGPLKWLYRALICGISKLCAALLEFLT